MDSFTQWVFTEHLVSPKSWARDQEYSSRQATLPGAGTVGVTRQLRWLNTQGSVTRDRQPRHYTGQTAVVRSRGVLWVECPGKVDLSRKGRPSQDAADEKEPAMQGAGKRQPKRRGLCEKTQKTPEKTDAVGHPRPPSLCYLIPGTAAFWGRAPRGKAETQQTLWSTGNHNL